MGNQYHSVRTTVIIKMMMSYITFGIVLMNNGASAKPEPYRDPRHYTNVITPHQKFPCCPFWYQRPPFCSFLGLMEPWGPMKAWEPCVDGYQHQNYQQRDYQQEDYQQQSNQHQDYSQDYFFGSMISMFIPKDISGALDKIGGILPGIKKTKQGILNFYRSMMPILGEVPMVFKQLVPSFKPITKAIEKGSRPSDSDAIKFKNAINDVAGPVLRKLGPVLKRELSTMRALSRGNVDEIIGQLSIIPDGEIKDLVRTLLTWAKSLIGSLVELID